MRPRYGPDGTSTAQSKEASRERQRAKAASRGGNRPMSTATLMAELAKVLPDDTAVASEAITGSPDVLHTLDFKDRNALLGPRGGGIGQGLPSAVALKLAQPARPVLAISGDGSALYTIQALWTAAHRRLDMVFLILNNGTYRVLKINMDHYRHMSGIAPDRGYPYLDLDDPRVDFVSAAAGFRVPGRRVEKVEEVIPCGRSRVRGRGAVPARRAGRPGLIREARTPSCRSTSLRTSSRDAAGAPAAP